MDHCKPLLPGAPPRVDSPSTNKVAEPASTRYSPAKIYVSISCFKSNDIKPTGNPSFSTPEDGHLKRP